jgi:hypothetical protein
MISLNFFIFSTSDSSTIILKLKTRNRSVGCLYDWVSFGEITAHEISHLLHI